MQKTISALVTVHNEEKIIASCLNKLNFCDEIIVILDNSTDRTKEICQKFTTKIYEGSFKYEGDRRNFGLEKCNSNWILEIDADEHVSEKLAEEIIEIINSKEGEKVNNFHIKVNNYIGSKLVKNGWGGSFGRGGVTCLFKKGTKIWGKQRVHPEVKFKGKFGKNLFNPIDHYFVDNISGLINKLDSWSYLKALDLVEQKKQDSLLRNIRRIFSRFLKNYFKRKGYKEGKLGFLISLFAGLFPILSYLRAELIKKNIK